MKTKKKATGNIDKVIQGGKAQIEQKQKPEKRKRRRTYYFNDEIIEIIEKNCKGNKSYFIEEAIKFYMANQKK